MGFLCVHGFFHVVLGMLVAAWSYKHALTRGQLWSLLEPAAAGEKENGKNSGLGVDGFCHCA